MAGGDVLEDFNWRGGVLECWTESGVVISSRQSTHTRTHTYQTTTPVTVHGTYGMHQSVGTAYVPTTHVSTTTEHRHQFWYRTSAGNEKVINLSNVHVDMLEGQVITMLLVGRKGSKTGYYACVVNHATSYYNEIATMRVLDRNTGFNKGISDKGVIEVAIGLLIALVLWWVLMHSRQAASVSPGVGGLACIALVLGLIYKQNQSHRQRAMSAWLKRCAEAAPRPMR